jgi:guanyl-specific ribonuclease Sa
MKYLFSFLLVATMLQIGTAQFGELTNKAKNSAEKLKNLSLSDDEIGSGLKEALNNGVSSASEFLSAKDGYLKSAYKILLPEEATKVTNKLKAVPGFSNVEADLVERMNRAAELAAVKAKPIFLQAIKEMSFKDALAILQGNPDAATRFLEKSTNEKLYLSFKPIIQAALDEVKARELWKDASTAYNKIPLVSKTNTELDDHVTRMALKGLFSLVEQKEKGIRSDVGLRNSDLLKKVFAKQDKK